MTQPFFVDRDRVLAAARQGQAVRADILRAAGLNNAIGTLERREATVMAHQDWLIGEMARGTPPMVAFLVLIEETVANLYSFGAMVDWPPERVTAYIQQQIATSMTMVARVDGTHGGTA